MDGESFQKVNRKPTRRDISKMEAEDRRRKAFWTTTRRNQEKSYIYKNHAMELAETHAVTDINYKKQVIVMRSGQEASTSKGQRVLGCSLEDQGQEKLATSKNDTTGGEENRNLHEKQGDKERAPSPIKQAKEILQGGERDLDPKARAKEA